MRLAYRLLLQSVIPLIALIGLVVFVVDRRVQRHVNEETTAQLARDARLIAILWTPGSDPHDVAQRAGSALGYRVTLIDTINMVVGESSFDAEAMAEMETHANRPEVIEARAHGIGIARRTSSTLGDEEWYVAVKVPPGIVRVSMSTAAAVETFSRVRRDILLIGAAGVALAILLTVVFTQKVSHPIIQLRDMARKLARHDFKGAVPPENAPGEVGELASTLKQVSEKLDALETTRRDFVANVSHELRTPLTIVGGFAETLVDDDEIPTANRRQFARSILDNTRRMQRIVDDLLDLSRIESGGWIPHPVEINLHAAISEAIGLERDAATAKGVTLEMHVAHDASRAMIDRTALRQVVTNLVGNAIRHTPTGGAITVFTERASSGIWIGVQDTGEGIATEHLSRIFERFYRVDSARARQAGGTGLGLAIVRHLAEAHGGYAYATSELGRGTTIRVFFPL